MEEKKKKNVAYIGIRHTMSSRSSAKYLKKLSKDKTESIWFTSRKMNIRTFTKIRHLAKFFGVHPNTVSRWIKTGELDHGDKSIIITTLNQED